jgi:hypothetical protein
MKIKAGIALIFAVFFSLAPTTASALDAPLLTWERGRVQEVVLGGGSASNGFTLTLEGNGITPIIFSESSPNEAGYVVFSVSVPSDIPLGAYSITTSGAGSPKSIVAGVNMIAAQEIRVISTPFDLSIIIAIFIFITTSISVLRARKYYELSIESTQNLPRLEDPVDMREKKFMERLTESPRRIRVAALASIKQSLFRYMLIREGEVLHRLSPSAYGLFPLLGFIGGAIAGVETLRNNGITNTPLTIFVVIALISIIDGFSGVMASLGFWLVAAVTGNVTSFRDLLVMFAIAFAWVAPSLLGGIYREMIAREFPRYISNLVSGLIGGVLFFFGHQLVNSVLITPAPKRAVSWIFILVIAVLVSIRGFADQKIVGKAPSFESIHRPERIAIARVSSPQTAFLLTAISFAFVYIWTESAMKALIVAILFSLPYYLLFIRFTEFSFLPLKNVPRNIVGESAVVAATAFIIFRQISTQPLLSDEKAYLFLIFAAIPGVIHAVYSAICASLEKMEIISK